MWPNPQKTADLFIFSEAINGKFHFCAVRGLLRTLQNIYDGAFYKNNSIIDVWEGSGYISKDN